MKTEFELTKQDIEKYLEKLNEKMKEKEIQGALLLTGGAVMTTVYDAREGTKDIDALFQPSSKIRECINQVAAENKLPEDWLNDAVKGYLNPRMQNAKSLYKDYSNLSVFTLDAEPLLAMKLVSGRMGTMDLDDSISLMKVLDIKNIEQCNEIVHKYMEPVYITHGTKIFTEIAYESYAVQKVAEKEKKPISQQIKSAKEKADNSPQKEQGKNKEKDR